MIELSKERIEQILHEETAENEELTTILRSIYTRYMHLYENYFTDIDALTDEKIAELGKYHEETKSLAKYYYLDIPLDIWAGLEAFDNEYTSRLLGPDWHDFLYDTYRDFKEKDNNKKDDSKASYSKQTLSDFYDVMNYIFRNDFGTESKHIEEVKDGILALLFGKSR